MMCSLRSFGVTSMFAHAESLPQTEAPFAPGVRGPVPGRRGLRRAPVPDQVPGRLRLPQVRRLAGDEAQAAALRSRMPGLQAADLGDGRDLHAPVACAAEGPVPRHPAGDGAFQRHPGPAARDRTGAGCNKAAWLPLRKLRGAMKEADAAPLFGVAEADETSVPFRSGNAERPSRGSEGRLLIAGAVEVKPGGKAGRVKLRTARDCSAPTLQGFLADASAPETEIRADGWLGCEGLPNLKQAAVGDRPAHEALAWIRRVFPNLKRWGLGVLHGFRRKHPDRYPGEWAFRWNRRYRRGGRLRHAAPRRAAIRTLGLERHRLRRSLIQGRNPSGTRPPCRGSADSAPPHPPNRRNNTRCQSRQAGFLMSRSGSAPNRRRAQSMFCISGLKAISLIGKMNNGRFANSHELMRTNRASRNSTSQIFFTFPTSVLCSYAPSRIVLWNFKSSSN